MEPILPIPISYISGNYYLFSIDSVSYLRRQHNICGVLSGTLPQIPQQNVFLGLPLELMPEEARLLVEKGVAYIVDEAKAHKDGMKLLMEEDRRRYLRDLEAQGLHAMRVQLSRKEQQREKSLKKIEEKKANAKKSKQGQEQEQEQLSSEDPAGLEAFFAPAPAPTPEQRSESGPRTSPDIEPMGITPPVSRPPLPTHPSPDQLLPLPEVPPSYPLFAHLHSKGYYLSPGLRFGCQYVAYPGDPLRFHSHFLVVSAEWEEEIDLMDIIAGGRLGTGVKKGFLLGGVDRRGRDGSGFEGEGDVNDGVRTFSIEWAGM